MPNWFVALPVPAASWFPALPAPPEEVRLFHPDDLHATVAFLGDVGEARARRAFDAMRACEIPPRRVELADVVPMGPPRKWTALSAAVRDPVPTDPALAELLEGPRDHGRAAAGVPRENRAMRPHVTLGRVARRAKGPGRKAGLAWAQALGEIGVEVDVERLALYTRAPKSDPRNFVVVVERPLG